MPLSQLQDLGKEHEKSLTSRTLAREQCWQPGSYGQWPLGVSDVAPGRHLQDIADQLGRHGARTWSSRWRGGNRGPAPPPDRASLRWSTGRWYFRPTSGWGHLYWSAVPTGYRPPVGCADSRWSPWTCVQLCLVISDAAGSWPQSFSYVQRPECHLVVWEKGLDKPPLCIGQLVTTGHCVKLLRGFEIISSSL